MNASHDRVFEKVLTVDGCTFVQKMDLTTDTAFYETLDGKLLMRVDSNADVLDADDNQIGRFNLDFSKGSRPTWYYRSTNGVLIFTNYELLFDDAEPYVVAKVFREQLVAE
jgi:hypothetical protein